jgi:hypothetical protein
MIRILLAFLIALSNFAAPIAGADNGETGVLIEIERNDYRLLAPHDQIQVLLVCSDVYTQLATYHLLGANTAVRLKQSGDFGIEFRDRQMMLKGYTTIIKPAICE